MARDQPHHTPATTPPTHHRHTPHTTHHRRKRTPARSGGDRPPPPAAKPSQEWRGVAHKNEGRTTPHTSHRESASRGKAKGATARPPPPPQKKRGGGRAKAAHSHQTARQQHRRRPNPPPRGHRRQDPQTGTGGPPSQNRQHQDRNRGPPGKGAPKQGDTHTQKKKASCPARKKGDGGGDHKARDSDTQQPEKKNKKAQKTHPHNPAKKGRAQRRPGPSTHGHTAHRNQKWRGARETRTKPHTTRKQTDTKAQLRTPQTAGKGGTTPQTKPKHTHPRPQPRWAGVNKTHDQPQPGPNNKRKPTVGNPVPTARALR